MTEIQNSEALILVGGKGTRLKAGDNEELKSWPKPLVRVSGEGSQTMLDWTLSGLKDRAGIDDYIFLTSEDPEAEGELIEAHVKAFYGEKPGKINSSVKFTRERSPLGTAGAINQGLKEVKHETILVTPIDTSFPFERIKEIPEDHPGRKSIIWMVTSFTGEAQQNPGKILCDKETSQIKYVLEGANPTLVADSERMKLNSLTSGGVLMVNTEYYLKTYPQYLESHPEKIDKPVSVYSEFIRWLVEQGEKIYAFDVKESVIDLGRPDALKRYTEENQN